MSVNIERLKEIAKPRDEDNHRRWLELYRHNKKGEQLCRTGVIQPTEQ